MSALVICLALYFLGVLGAGLAMGVHNVEEADRPHSRPDMEIAWALIWPVLVLALGTLVGMGYVKVRRS